jgi:NAD(P)-dependent dehydrogenase (short-subunit alcohol dehydrogenase family)
MDTDLTGDTAFVTGASRGIGRVVAATLADAGANVALAARSDGIHETADLIDAPERTLAVETDVTDEDSVRKSIEATVAEFGGLDCLVNNAGIAGPTAPVEAVERADFERTMAVNVTGPFLCVKHAVEHLRESDNPSIVTVSSVSGKRPLPERTPYTASKMAVIGLTRTLAFELPDPIRVNTVCPGPVTGPRLTRVVENQAESRGIDYETAAEEVFGADMAISDLIEPEDVADVVLYLASERGARVTAQDINVDGGLTWY